MITEPGSPRSTMIICRSSTPPPICGSSWARACRTRGGSPSASARPPIPRTTSGSAGRSAMRSPTATGRSLLIASGALSATPSGRCGNCASTRPPRSSTSSRRRPLPLTLSGCTGSRHGDHARVLETMPEFYRYRPEARFGHYLMMIGALGEGDCTATGRRYGEYENSIGTGQVHYWFDRPDGGFPRPRRTPRIPTSSHRRPAPTCTRRAEAVGPPRSDPAAPRDSPDPARRQRRRCRPP